MPIKEHFLRRGSLSSLFFFFPQCGNLAEQWRMVRHLPTIRETRVQYLGREDLLEKEMATHSSTLAWKIPWMEEHGRLQPVGSQRVGQNWVISLGLGLGRGKVTYQDRQSLFLVAQRASLGNLYQSAQPVPLAGLEAQGDGFSHSVSQIFHLHLSAWDNDRRTAFLVIGLWDIILY